METGAAMKEADAKPRDLLSAAVVFMDWNLNQKLEFFSQAPVDVGSWMISLP
jgi:hypothetical protein